MLIIDVSLALPWPCKPRVFVPFVGTIRYSSVRAHRGREQVDNPFNQSYSNSNNPVVNEGVKEKEK